MKFRTITRGASILSMILWVAAASFWAMGSGPSFFIVGLLAGLGQVIAINSAKREGYDAGARKNFFDKVMDEVGR